MEGINKEYHDRGYQKGSKEIEDKIKETIQRKIDKMFDELEVERTESKRRDLIREIKGMDLAYKIAMFGGNY